MAPILPCTSCWRSWNARAPPWPLGGSVAHSANRWRPVQADVERLLAQLYTDRALRERFLADRLVVAREHRLSEQECSALAQMPEQDLQTAARSFEKKRENKKAQKRLSFFKNWLSKR